MKFIIQLLSVLLCSTVINTGYCAKKATVQKNDASDLIDGNFDKTSTSSRTRIANDILEQIKSLNSFIPSITPNEATWIQNELEETKNNPFGTRKINLINSTEFQENKLKDYLDSIASSISMVLVSKNIKDEMYWWGNVAYLLMDESTLNDALHTLKNNGKFPSEISKSRNVCVGTGEYGTDYNMCYHVYGEGILFYFILPYIHNEKMDNP